MSVLPAGGFLVPPNTYPGNLTTLYSDDFVHWVTMQGDGNLVLYEQGRALWASGTNYWTGNNFTGWCAMQFDGNLVLYEQDGTPFWASNTSGNWGNYPSNVPDGSFPLSPYLNMQNDGNLVIYTEAAIWATGTQGQ
jgi:hypothetical protein